MTSYIKLQRGQDVELRKNSQSSFSLIHVD